MQNQKALLSRQLLYRLAMRASSIHSLSLPLRHAHLESLPPSSTLLDLKVKNWDSAAIGGIGNSLCSHYVAAVDGISAETNIFALGEALFAIIAEAEFCERMGGTIKRLEEG
ncbi:hypothetical protein D6D04_04623 [Aureobasidium pullulans]|nr:hypothetical protein D6D04_04623 [Aureobasidium pullulans]